MNNFRISAILGVTALAWGIALAVEPPAQGASRDAMFQRLDRNHDGVISKEEAAHERDFVRAFNDADENHDGQLSADEYVKASAIYDRIRAAGYMHDAKITAMVKTALLTDEKVHGLKISVETRDGVVLLSGFISRPEEAQRALKLATGVEGVREVRSQLVVQQG